MKRKLPLTMTKVTRNRARCLMLLLLLSMSQFSHAQISLLKDVNRWSDPYYNDFNSIEGHGNGAFFHGGDSLYFTDGTPNGTVALTAMDYPDGGHSYNGYYYFSNGESLWRSDGTVAGTTFFKDVLPSEEYVFFNPVYVEMNGILYFKGRTVSTGIEIWRTDGTVAGTYVLKDVKPGSASADPQNLTVVGNKLFFSAPSGNNKGIELWVSDGTQTGTTMVYDINPGSNSSDPANMVGVDGICYFTAKNPTYGKELWRSDGTAAGTWMVKDIRPGSAGTIDKLRAVNNLVMFEAHDGVHGKEIWKSDGTEAGTQMVKDIYPGSNGSSPEPYVTTEVFSYGGIYYFISSYVSNRLWRSDGTEAGTYPITSPMQGADYSFMYMNFTVFNDEVYFMAQDDWLYTQLWKTGGTLANTVKLDNRFGYFTYGNSARLAACGQNLMMISQEVELPTGVMSPTKIRIGDGTPGGTTDVFTLPAPSVGSSPQYFIALDNATLFAGQEGGDFLFHNLYRTDGTSSGTSEVKKFKHVHTMQRLDNQRVVLTAQLVEGGSALYVSDGTTSGTQNITPAGAPPLRIRSSANANGWVFFHGANYSSGTSNGLYKTNGTSAGTVLLKSFEGDGFGAFEMAAYGDKLLFSAPENPPAYQQELWISDGTAAGTSILANINPAGGSSPHLFTPVNGNMIFTAWDGAGYELYITDGTTAGTSKLKDFSPAKNEIQELTAFDNKALFTVSNDADGRSLWVTDGTAAGTLLVKDFAAGFEQIDIVEQVGIDMMVLVTIGGQTALWKTNGTTAGTILVKQFDVQFTHIYKATSEVINGVLYFARQAEGGGLWRTDGTDCGTFQIESSLPISVQDIGSVGATVLFNGNINEQSYISEFGPELYRYDVEGIAPCEAVARAAQFNDEMNGDDTMRSYPNPFKHELIVQVNGEANRTYAVEVFALNGRRIQSTAELIFNEKYPMGSEWPEGIYLLKANVNGKIVTRKVVKTH
ncbi:ELWxxDGT repeat protein [Pseudochryseolinea flava]|uniref:Secretion system C-terminal sorting domain-containing protein n=1 Tax=Pseudochryseolinea flava TaxID=2059302 RepID=A0A364XXS6_9BACT|nr:ELWxxDGT repeat protein [Pseudochryseolinea flava]RAV99210.1 hypothetical protein DQQ10_20130 [Pseudochryseolinea flava]